jgi:hypothetical protein
MSRTTTEAGSSTDESGPTLWAGWIMFGSLMMMMVGGFHVVQGLVALLRDEVFLVRQEGLALELDYSAWGWAHLVFGVVVMVTGFAVLFGPIWARVVGVLIAMVSALANLAFLAAYPIWSTIMIAFDVIVIWALAVHGGEMRVTRDRSR